MNEKIKIIYVDDEEINVTLFRINISKKYEVLSGYSGADGLELLELHPETKFIFSDMKMPGMNGLDFIKQANKKFNNKSFYILTGYDITEEIRDALETGLIIKYFKKPYNIKEIEAEINKMLH